MRALPALLLLAGAAAAQPAADPPSMAGTWVRAGRTGAEPGSPRPTLDLQRDGTCRRGVLDGASARATPCRWVFDAEAGRLTVTEAAPARTGPAAAARPVTLEVRWCGANEVLLTGAEGSQEWHRMIRGPRFRPSYC